MIWDLRYVPKQHHSLVGKKKFCRKFRPGRPERVPPRENFFPNFRIIKIQSVGTPVDLVRQQAWLGGFPSGQGLADFACLGAHQGETYHTPLKSIWRKLALGRRKHQCVPTTTPPLKNSFLGVLI